MYNGGRFAIEQMPLFPGERIMSLTVDALDLFRFLRLADVSFFTRRIIGSSRRSGEYSYGNECPVTAAYKRDLWILEG